MLMDEEVRAGVLLVRTPAGRFHRRYVADRHLVDDPRCDFDVTLLSHVEPIELIDADIDRFCEWCFPGSREPIWV